MTLFNHVHIDMFRKSECGSIVALVSSHVCSVMLVEISGLVNGFVEDQGLYSPIDCGVGFP